jgi:hypothetical protein
MTANQFWRDFVDVLRSKFDPTGVPDEYFVEALRSRGKNRLRIQADGVWRTTPNGAEHLISKERIFWIAKHAIDAPDGNYSLADIDLSDAGGAYGSILGAVFNELPYMKYESKGRMMRYVPK